MKLNLWEMSVYVMLVTKGHSNKTMPIPSIVQHASQNGVIII